MRHLVKVGTLLCVLALAAGCGDDGDDGTATDAPSAPSEPSESTATPSEPSPSEKETSEAPAPKGTVVEVTLEDGQITPNGERVQAKAGEPVTFEIDADAPGELHVHSTPDYEIAFEAGTSSHEIVIDQPGIVEVELHEPALVVVQLELR